MKRKYRVTTDVYGTRRSKHFDFIITAENDTDAQHIVKECFEDWMSDWDPECEFDVWEDCAVEEYDGKREEGDLQFEVIKVWH